MNELSDFLGISISPELKERLRKQAKIEDRPMAWITRQAIVAYLELAQQKMSSQNDN